MQARQIARKRRFGFAAHILKPPFQKWIGKRNHAEAKEKTRHCAQQPVQRANPTANVEVRRKRAPRKPDRPRIRITKPPAGEVIDEVRRAVYRHRRQEEEEQPHRQRLQSVLMAHQCVEQPRCQHAAVHARQTVGDSRFVPQLWVADECAQRQFIRRVGAMRYQCWQIITCEKSTRFPTEKVTALGQLVACEAV